jgi:hypothetical protein
MIETDRRICGRADLSRPQRRPRSKGRDAVNSLITPSVEDKTYGLQVVMGCKGGFEIEIAILFWENV